MPAYIIHINLSAISLEFSLLHTKKSKCSFNKHSIWYNINKKHILGYFDLTVYENTYTSASIIAISHSRELCISDVEDFIKKTFTNNNIEIQRMDIDNFREITVDDYHRLHHQRKCNKSRHISRKRFNHSFPKIKKQYRDKSALEKFESLIGLVEVKTMLKRIITASKVRQLQKNYGIITSFPTLHMVFTGNPGTAKTTTARLLAQILKNEKVINTGSFIECGRSDLVGKYIGWTAKIVKKKFKQARGGILFIDEAYSLIDDTHSFGYEAINTIVQEMENHRDDVIVIFAGYKEPMDNFIKYNEGLRSRIPFYIDFPDYNAQELTEILQLMVKERGYIINDNILRKCYAAFQQAIKVENFGNGRFVRNILDGACLLQAERIMNRNDTIKINKQQLMSFSEDDFIQLHQNRCPFIKKEIGFKH